MEKCACVGVASTLPPSLMWRWQCVDSGQRSTNEQAAKPLPPIAVNILIGSGGGGGIVQGGGEGTMMMSPLLLA